MIPCVAIVNQLPLLCSPTAPVIAPSNVSWLNVSSTALKMTWSGIPSPLRNGIIRGYRIFVWRHSEGNESSFKTTVPSTPLVAQIDSLEKWTNYCGQIAAFTRIAYGPRSLVVCGQTSEDGKAFYTVMFFSLTFRMRSNFQGGKKNSLRHAVSFCYAPQYTFYNLLKFFARVIEDRSLFLLLNDVVFHTTCDNHLRGKLRRTNIALCENIFVIHLLGPHTLFDDLLYDRQSLRFSSEALIYFEAIIPKFKRTFLMGIKT